jgi:hypothetical protein
MDPTDQSSQEVTACLCRIDPRRPDADDAGVSGYYNPVTGL